MTTLNDSNDIFTLVNVFNVEPENQQELVDLLIQATEDTMQHVPGFISANIHKGLDGTRVVNYAQWESKQHFNEMLSNPDAIEHMKKAESLINSFGPVQAKLIDSLTK